MVVHSEKHISEEDISEEYITEEDISEEDVSEEDISEEDILTHLFRIIKQSFQFRQEEKKFSSLILVFLSFYH